MTTQLILLHLIKRWSKISQFILLLSSLALGSSDFSNTRVDSKDSLFKELGGVLYYRSQPFSGVQIEYFPNGLIYKETHFKKGFKEGISKEYAVNGALRAKWNFHLSKKHGFQEGWYIEGPKRFEANYKEGLLDGVQMEWHLNGILFRRQTFSKGIETSKKILYPTEEVFSNYKKRNGRIFGLDGGALCFEKKKEGEK